MFVLYLKKPTPIFNGKTGYIMSWRGKQIAMCAHREPLENYIRKQERPDIFYIEEFPN